MLAIERKKSTLQKNMESLLSDMKRLQREEEILKEESRKKKESIDANLDFIENWLEKTKELREYHETPEVEKREFFQLRAGDKRGWEFTSYPTPYSKSQKVMNNVNDTRICGFNDKHMLYNTPSLSFIQYVECTFNLFTQLTERIKELEKKINNSVENSTSSNILT